MTLHPRRLLRHPVAHFAALGALLFGLAASRPEPAQKPAVPARSPIVVNAERIRAMRADFQQRWSVAPTPAQLRALIEQTVEEEILYREARVLALDYQDASVRRRLIEKARAVIRRPFRGDDDLYQEALALGLDDDLVIRRLLIEKMRLVLQDDGADGAIPDAAVRDYLQRHHARFALPETVTFTQVFVSASAHRDRLAAAVDAVRAQLASDSPPSVLATRLSDPFPLGQHLRAYTRNQVMARFGEPFAEQLFTLPPGRWSDPIASPYGSHLVWVHEHVAKRLPPLDSVHQAITLALLQERAADNLQRGLARLCALYDIRIDGDST